jgi:protein-S-isoprenylcysteine O-methyltransferase Ste14
MKRWLVLLFGLANYGLFLGIFLYMLGFIGGFAVPRTLDGPRTVPLTEAVPIDLLLLAVFALQHSVMARPTFKQWWTQFVPAPIERSTYVLATDLALALMFWQWQPLGMEIWNVEQPMLRAALWTLYAVGWLTVLVTTFLINHFDLFGLRQVWLYFHGRPYTSLPFATPGPYRLVRHPLYVGWLLAFWATPTMGLAHLVFALGMTAYILVAIRLEERNLAEYHGEFYRAYRQRVPMLMPRMPSKPAIPAADVADAAVAAPVGIDSADDVTLDWPYSPSQN